MEERGILLLAELEEALTPAQRRNHLLGIFYYETSEGRERRAAKAVEDALKAAKRQGDLAKAH